MRTESRNDTSEFRVDQRTLVIFHEQSPARRARRRGGGAGVGPISGPTGPAECAALTRAERAACRRHLAGRRESQLRRPAGNCPDQSVPQGACGRGPDNQRTHVFTEVYLCVLSDCSTDCFRDRGWLQAARMAGSCTWCEVSPGDHELRSDVMTKIYSACARASLGPRCAGWRGKAVLSGCRCRPRGSSWGRRGWTTERWGGTQWQEEGGAGGA